MKAKQNPGVTRRRFVWSAAAGALVAGVAAKPKWAMSQGTVGIKYISMHAPQLFWAKFYNELEKQAREITKGDLKIEWAGGPETMPPLQAPEAISKGVFDMCLSTFGFYGNAIPEGVGLQVNMASLKGLRDSGALAFMDEIHRKKLGVTILGLPSTGVGYGVFANKPVATLDDLKGRKFRSLGLQVPMMKALGVSTVAVAPAETYSALERGVVEGLTWPLVGVAEFRYHEIAKYLVRPPYYHSIVDHIMNAKKFDGLPKDIQDALLKASRATDEWGLQFTLKSAADELEVMKKAGLVENVLPPADAKRFIVVATNEAWAKIVA
ncbi:MAG: hypothetical protein EXQ91_07500, partial [Alphaproteobacteria bacterium]|nr:hypothetical protein [Alphaproteobacteria bacterium]